MTVARHALDLEGDVVDGQSGAEPLGELVSNDDGSHAERNVKAHRGWRTAAVVLAYRSPSGTCTAMRSDFLIGAGILLSGQVSIRAQSMGAVTNLVKRSTGCSPLPPQSHGGPAAPAGARGWPCRSR